MRVKLLFFASCKDITGCRETEIEIEEGINVESFRRVLLDDFPALQGMIKTLSIAVNTEYAADGTVLQAGDEIALIPPVSGGE
jgi:molybdopterin converting factor subunit 1